MLMRFVTAAMQFALNQFTQEAPTATPPSDSTLEIVAAIYHRLKNGEEDDIDVSAIIAALRDIPDSEDLLKIVDADNYNLLQKAIIWNKEELVSFLVNRGVDCNATPRQGCDRPLHLASFLGRIDIVSVLLAGGADPGLKSRLSLTAPRGPEALVPESMTPVARERLMKIDPEGIADASHFAILADNVDILRLVSSSRSNLPVSLTSALLLASKFGARRCFLFALDDVECDVNVVDDDDSTPLHYAVLKGKWFTEKLLHKGAQIRARNRFGQHALHALFAVDGRLNDEFAEVAKLLLDVGIHREINSLDRHGYTPLLLLLHHINSCWNFTKTCYSTSHSPISTSRLNADIERCVRLMLNYGADPNVQCSTGHTALHVLLHRNLFAYATHDTVGSNRTDISGAFVILDILRLLIEKGGADVNLPLKDGLITPLLTWIFSLQTCNISPEELVALRSPFLAALELLLVNGADPNIRPAFALSPLSTMVSWCQIWMNRGESASLLAVLPVVNEILALLFRFNASVVSVVRVNRRLVFYNTYEEILSMCLNVFDSSDLEVVSRLTTTLMLWCLPNQLYLSPHRFEGAQIMAAIRRHILCQYLELGIKFARLVESGPHYENCLRLFCHLIDSGTMFACLASALKTYDDSVGDGVTAWNGTAIAHTNSAPPAVSNSVTSAASSVNRRSTIRRLILERLTNAESLKSLCRKRILTALNGKTPPKVERLRIPNSLKDYLLDLTVA